MQWWLGDWWHYGAHAYGERKAKVKAKRAFPYAFATLMNWGWVAGKVATSLRREALSWSHHALIASYPPDEQKKWLDKAEKWEWTVKHLGQKIYEAPDRRSEEERHYDHVRLWALRFEEEASRSGIGPASRISISNSRACRRLVSDRSPRSATKRRHGGRTRVTNFATSVQRSPEWKEKHGVSRRRPTQSTD